LKIIGIRPSLSVSIVAAAANPAQGPSLADRGLPLSHAINADKKQKKADGIETQGSKATAFSNQAADFSAPPFSSPGFFGKLRPGSAID
jgi:hypothetical protein